MTSSSEKVRTHSVRETISWSICIREVRSGEDEEISDRSVYSGVNAARTSLISYVKAVSTAGANFAEAVTA